MERRPSFLSRDVTYSCGYCGYSLKLKSSDRNTSKIGTKYCKSIKKGLILFETVDESRFTLVDEQKCWPYFPWKNLWRLLRHYRPKVKLLCKKCHMFVGYGYEDVAGSSSSDGSDFGLGLGVSSCRKYAVNIRALQPSVETTAAL